MVVPCTCFFRELLHGSTSVIRLLDTGYVHGLDHLASFFEKLSKLIFSVRLEIRCYKTPGLDHLGSNPKNVWAYDRPAML